MQTAESGLLTSGLFGLAGDTSHNSLFVTQPYFLNDVPTIKGFTVGRGMPAQHYEIQVPIP